MKSRKKLWITVLCLIIVVAAGALALNRGYDYFMKRSYPLHYQEIVEQEAAKNGLSPALVYAVIRTESGFRPNAQSKAEACGLMQLTPSTFTWLQTKLKSDITYNKEDLFNPEINIRYGCKFLEILLEKYGNTETVLAAYNAGIGRVNTWLKDGEISADGKTLMSIPFKETKNYVNSVMKSYKKYQELYSF